MAWLKSLVQYYQVIFPVITVVCLILFYRYYYKVSRPLKVIPEPDMQDTPVTTDTPDMQDTPAAPETPVKPVRFRPRFTLTHRRYPMRRLDILPMLAITLIYAAVAFTALGDMTNPQSFFRFTKEENSVVITLAEPTDIGTLMYYPGLWIGGYSLEFSSDGVNWQAQYPKGDHKSAMNQPHSDLFKWLRADLNDDNDPTQYIRITSTAQPLELGELAIKTKDGSFLPASQISSPGAPQLFDEQDIVPDAASYMNSMYFDEIYHGRSAYEYLNNHTIYETTHPPLGKLIIAVGVHLFGMVPFGWRFMGTLFGVLMLPILYVFLKNMFGKTVIASCGTILFAFDFMHFVQTRIATIDTYGVFFILVSYYFMYRYITQHPKTPFKKTIAPLALSGLFFGIGCASKWIVIYSGVGLLALYVLRLVMTFRYYRKKETTGFDTTDERTGFSSYLFKTLGLSFVFYIIVPAIVYCLSYVLNGRVAGMRIADGMLWDPKFYKMIWDNQTFMFSYHSKLVATHSYGSNWYQWIVNGRPILYYLDTSMGHGLKSAFASFGNPIVWWGGFMAVIVMVYRVVTRRDGRALFILVGYFVQLAPWIIITRVVFIYHYFPCVLFMVFAIAHVLNTIWDRKKGRYKLAVYGFTAAAVLLFAVFYPVLSGVPAPANYERYFLAWIPHAWPF